MNSIIFIASKLLGNKILHATNIILIIFLIITLVVGKTKQSYADVSNNIQINSIKKELENYTIASNDLYKTLLISDNGVILQTTFSNSQNVVEKIIVREFGNDEKIALDAIYSDATNFMYYNQTNFTN